MSGLLLVADYSSSSEEDSSETRANRINLENIVASPVKRLPLPSIFSKKEEVAEHEDDPEKHEGRVRNFPHQRGNWSTFVYIPYDTNKQFHKLVSGLHEKCCQVTKFHRVEDFHISLSRTVVLKFHWINNFISALRSHLETVEKFAVIFDSLGIYCNDDKTRTFLSLEVGFTGSSDLETIVTKVDHSLKEFNLQTFYQDPSFHISLLWCVGDKRRELEAILPNLETTFSEIVDNPSVEENSFCEKLVDSVACKSGNKTFSFLLR